MKLSSLLLASLVESGRDWSLLDKYKLMRNSDFTTGGLLQPRVSFFESGRSEAPREEDFNLRLDISSSGEP